MKKLLVALCFTCALALAAHAEDKAEGGKSEAKKPQLTAEQKAARKALVEKYDTNKDGKIDKNERAPISAEELEKAGFGKHTGKAKKANDLLDSLAKEGEAVELEAPVSRGGAGPSVAASVAVPGEPVAGSGARRATADDEDLGGDVGGIGHDSSVAAP